MAAEEVKDKRSKGKQTSVAMVGGMAIEKNEREIVVDSPSGDSLVEKKGGRELLPLGGEDPLGLGPLLVGDGPPASAGAGSGTRLLWESAPLKGQDG